MTTSASPKHRRSFTVRTASSGQSGPGSREAGQRATQPYRTCQPIFGAPVGGAQPSLPESKSEGPAFPSTSTNKSTNTIQIGFSLFRYAQLKHIDQERDLDNPPSPQSWLTNTYVDILFPDMVPRVPFPFCASSTQSERRYGRKRKIKSSCDADWLTRNGFTERRGGCRDQEEENLPQVLLPRYRPRCVRCPPILRLHITIRNDGLAGWLVMGDECER